MQIDHIGLYVNNLEQAKDFFVRYLRAACGAGYCNPKTGFRSYFLTFGDGARLEIMQRPDTEDMAKPPLRTGYAHLAFHVGSKDTVDALTEELRLAGYTVVSGPRTTGDGYYESCVLDAEGNGIELTV